MNPSLNLFHLETVKTLTLAVAGIKNMTISDCRFLSFLIIQKTGYGISETTIKRIFGFLDSKFGPSLFSLNTLSIYCDFSGWEDFCNCQRGTIRSDSQDVDYPLDSPLLEIMMDTSVPVVIVDANTACFQVYAYNKAFANLQVNRSVRLNGSPLTDAFGSQRSAEGKATLKMAITEANESGKIVYLSSLPYDMPSPVSYVDTPSWWDVKVVPVNLPGSAPYVLLYLEEVTEKVLPEDEIEEAIAKELTRAEDLAIANVKLNKAIANFAEIHQELLDTKMQLEEHNFHLEQRLLERSKKLAESEAKQRALIDNAPVAIGVLKGPDHVIETANQKIIEYWGKDHEVVGLPLEHALPEIKGQPFIDILDQVRYSGRAYINPELEAFLEINGKMEARYFDMIYQPVQIEPGITDAIYVIAIDITEQVIKFA